MFLLACYFISACLTALLVARWKRVDVILAHWVLPMGPVGAIVASCLGRPLVVVAHGSDVNRYASQGFGQRLCRWALSRSQRVVAVSHDLEEQLMHKFGVPMGKLVYLPMGVDAELFHLPSEETARQQTAGRDDERHVDRRTSACREAKNRLSLRPDSVVLLFVGDLISTKGVPELVAAWHRLRQRQIDVSLCLLGDGALREGLEAELHGEIRDGDCRLPGRVPQGELPVWYRAADLFVLPSHSEGTPVVVMEALACGLPVVSTRVGGIGELVEDGVSGCIIPPRDVETLSATLEALIADEARLERFRRRLRRHPRDYSSRASACRLRGVLEEVWEMK